MDGTAFGGTISLLIGIIVMVIAWIISRRKTALYQHAIRTEGNIITLVRRETREFGC